jgi:Tfp pilus assembly protein PilF
MGVIILSILLLVISGQTPEVVREADSFFQRGVERQQLGDAAGAQQFYEQVLRLMPKRLDALSNLGVVYARQGMHDKAIVRYREALAIAPVSSGSDSIWGLPVFRSKITARRSTSSHRW